MAGYRMVSDRRLLIKSSDRFVDGRAAEVLQHSCGPSMAYFARPQSRNAAVKIVTPTTQEDKAKSPSKKGGS
jgi:hypothetical protein